MFVASTLESVGIVELAWPERVIAAEGLSNDLGTVTLRWPVKSLTAYGGGYASLVWPTRALAVEGTLNIVGTVVLVWPRRLLTATGLMGSAGTISLVWPTRTITMAGLTGGVGTVDLRWPTLTVVAMGSGAATETTYAINLTTGAVTQLVLGAFNKLVTAHGRAYGLRNETLFYLGGETDEGAEIPATVRFAAQDFGTYQVKRLDGAVYLKSREDDGLTLTIIQDETTTWKYQTNTDTSPGLGSHRGKVGRGISFHSLGMILENREGGRLDVGGIEILMYPLTRRPK